MDKIQIAKSLALPIDAVTETFAFLAKRGAGKSYAASVMVEGMLDLMLQVVVLDPMGIWYGLRTKKDGKSAGYQIPIIGGEHGDIPLESTSGKMVADLVMADRLSVVLDVSLFTKGERKRFVADFAERLYRKNREAMHLVLEEADMFAPQKPQQGEQRMLGAIEDLVRRGRSRGIGLSLISQRSAVLNKDVLTQTECLVALRTTAPHDRRAIKDWIDAHADRDEQKVVLDSLPSLPTGTAWFWSPAWLEQLQKVKVNRKKTLDTGATPKAGVKRKPQKAIAEVNLSQLTEKMSATIEKAKAEDPRLLQARIRELEKKVTEPVGKYVNRMVEKDIEDREKEWQRVFAEQQKLIGELRHRTDKVAKILYDTGWKLLDEREYFLRDSEELQSPPPDPKPLDSASNPTPTAESIEDVANQAIGPKLPNGARRMIETIVAARPRSLTKQQVGFLSKVSPHGGTFGTYLSKLRKAGLIAEGDGEITATDAAVAAYQSSAQLMSRNELIQAYRSKLPGGAQRMLDILDKENGAWLDKNKLGDLASISTAGGTFGTYLSKLRVNGLIEQADGDIRLSAWLLEAE